MSDLYLHFFYSSFLQWLCRIIYVFWWFHITMGCIILRWTQLVVYEYQLSSAFVRCNVISYYWQIYNRCGNIYQQLVGKAELPRKLMRLGLKELGQFEWIISVIWPNCLEFYWDGCSFRLDWAKLVKVVWKRSRSFKMNWSKINFSRVGRGEVMIRPWMLLEVFFMWLNRFIYPRMSAPFNVVSTPFSRSQKLVPS